MNGLSVACFVATEAIMANNCQAFRDIVGEREATLRFAEGRCQALEQQDVDPLTFRQQCIIPRAQAKAELERALEALRNCEAGLPPAGRRRSTGRVVFLRVHESNIGFGAAPDVLTGEVVFKLDTQSQPGRAFGFSLSGTGTNGRARESMLALLRDALAHGFDVTIEYTQVLNRAKSVVDRIELTPPEETLAIPILPDLDL
jgi:hypothetical protein